MKHLRHLHYCWLLILIAMVSLGAKSDQILLLVKYETNGEPTFAIGPQEQNQSSLADFLQTAHLKTNLPAIAQWLGQTNLSLRYLRIATPKADSPVTAASQIWSEQEWLILSSAIRRVDTNAPGFKPLLTPEQAIDTAKRLASDRGWEKSTADIPTLQKGSWSITVRRLPQVFGGHATVEISPDGKTKYIAGL